MTKANKKSGKPIGKATVTQTVAGNQSVEAATKTISIARKAVKFKGARASWYAALLAHDGRTDDAFVDACTKKPPAMSINGKADNPRGWLRWFVRTGVATLS